MQLGNIGSRKRNLPIRIIIRYSLNIIKNKYSKVKTNNFYLTITNTHTLILERDTQQNPPKTKSSKTIPTPTPDKHPSKASTRKE